MCWLYHFLLSLRSPHLVLDDVYLINLGVLNSKMVQALVCTQDCLRNPSIEDENKKIEEQIQELNKIDNGMPLFIY
ncbi:hypothetical protein GQ457_05G015750 [Hibiscus cannabinus]